MSQFPDLPEKNPGSREREIADEWYDMNLLEKCVEQRKDNEPYVFYEGPPTANGKPGIHHVIARTLKDTVCRYHTMQGYMVKRKGGWDTHGLPVEIEVEKELDLNSKEEIEEYGIDEFNQKCRQSVFEYEEQWREMTERMGYLIDMDDPYITLENDYIESVWWILDQFFEEGFIYEGHKILPYCARCGTGLASHEVAQGYEEITSNSVYVRVKRKDKNEYFLIWTTTPWTLAANVTLTVHPDKTYVKARYQGDLYYIEKDRAEEVFVEDYEIVERVKGEELEGIEYEQIMPFVEVKSDKDAFYVTLGDYVTAEEGTGIVHSAPAFGEEDYKTGQKYDLPVLQPVNEDGKYTDTPWEGQFVMDANENIVEWLIDNEKLVRSQKVDHNYPHCWRCDTPLLYYARGSWYIEMTRIKERLIENNDGVEWYPDFVGEKRFGNWLENLQDWALSRNRYWGTPLNIWRCDCGELTSVASVDEMRERAVNEVSEDIELHRPYVDEVLLECPECGGDMQRVEEVIDCWFDSGSMPFAQWHYPFENEDVFEEQFPADFICEGIDQTRGWFYSLIAISSFITGESPYKRVLVNDLILDAEGKKMSKSRGNTVDPFNMFEKYGADVLRWYLLQVSPPWTPTRFDEEGMQEIDSKFYRTLKNVYYFFKLYANTDEIDPREFSVDLEERNRIDRWVISRLHSTLAEVEKQMDEYHLTNAVRELQDFIDEDLSNWYIRRCRRRFWADELDRDKKSVFQTTYEVLEKLARAIAPFAPFISDDVHRSLTDSESVHLQDYPGADNELIAEDLEERMGLVRDLVTMGRAAREAEELKVRQPIARVLISSDHKDKLAELKPLLKEELNVKKVEHTEDPGQYMEYEVKPNFEKVGPQLRDKVKLFAGSLAEMDSRKTAKKLEAGEKLTVDLDGEKFTFGEEEVIINISSREGYSIGMEDNEFIILETELSPELKAEGYAREFISRVQNLRKKHDFDVLDRIKIYYSSSQEIDRAVEQFHDYISEETLADEIISVEESDLKEADEFELNGEPALIKVKRL
ncbi:isoleucine--tRNA ligase [Halarsenatibacter silvermanii]|uniref:Isoleucine--tRNA ligase n=1 Tax=Halarsenatibacter silvermanii TaxID=321763 RepID=A0A1G9L0R0_9FIRM|nr:isoleucine--tRNA ligase [Halarsenatibacter silvermanii]SDL55571.1 Isoleucyl-tRNA synthetase [Halarsenatibacter silvermanii]